MMHRRDDFGSWMVRGFAIALGFLLFKLFALAVILSAVLVWQTSGKCKPPWRQIMRAVFIFGGAVVVLGILAVVFSN
ncbi:MAG TPA: hypothetical protein VGT24_13230 [Candidatus Acidoferrales bacterium]|nr:hypothetical protein [Candidatus Acidoferrales bacterium]